MHYYEDIRKILETRFLFTEAGDRRVPSYKVFLEGRKFTQPKAPDSWVVMSIDESGSALKGFHRDLRKTSGTVRFKISVHGGKGSKNARTIADGLNLDMSFTGGNSGVENADGTLYVMAGSMRKLSDDDSGYLNYVIDFGYDYYTS